MAARSPDALAPSNEAAQTLAEAQTAADAATPAVRANPLRRRDFRLLWAGQAVSTLGDQFTFVALPWLALVVTGSALALGSVLALMAIPRAVLMLFGGVYVDRLTPRRVMLLANAGRLVVVTALAVAALAGQVGLPLLYVVALLFGVADAFFFPAQQAIIPELVPSEEIAAANALAQGTTQLTVFAGPAIAGVLVAALASSGTQPSLTGIAIALLVDAATFVVSLVSLTLIAPSAPRTHASEPVLDALKAGLRFVWAWPSLRFIVLFAMVVNFLVVGPLNVGLPVIAYTRLREGAAAYGTVVSAMGGGALLGMVAYGALPRPSGRLFGPFVLSIMAVMGLGLATLSFADSTAMAFAVTGVMGAGMGYGNLAAITWAQQRIPRALMGRVFSLILLGSIALIPVSQVIAGALVTVSLSGMLVAAGLAMAAVTIAFALAPTVRRMGLEPVLVEAEA